LHADDLDRDLEPMNNAAARFDGDVRSGTCCRIVVFEDFSANRWDLIERTE